MKILVDQFDLPIGSRIFKTKDEWDLFESDYNKPAHEYIWGTPERFPCILLMGSTHEEFMSAKTVREVSFIYDFKLDAEEGDLPYNRVLSEDRIMAWLRMMPRNADGSYAVERFTVMDVEACLRGVVSEIARKFPSEVQWRENVEHLLSEPETRPFLVRVREGGGPEDLVQSLVVTFIKMRKAATEAYANFEAWWKDFGFYKQDEQTVRIAREAFAAGRKSK